MSSHQVPKHKLVFLGDVSVGKTSIINRFMYDSYDNNYNPTIGIDFLSKTMFLGDRSLRLQIWDTAGQERFRSLIPNYIRDASVAILVFDLSNKLSFLSIDKWVEDVQSERGPEALIFIVGNKSDLTEERAVTQEEANEKAKEVQCIYIETSVRSGVNIEELFKEISSVLPLEERLSLQVAHPELVDIKLGAEAAQNAHKRQQGCRC